MHGRHDCHLLSPTTHPPRLSTIAHNPMPISFSKMAFRSASVCAVFLPSDIWVVVAAGAALGATLGLSKAISPKQKSVTMPWLSQWRALLPRCDFVFSEQVSVSDSAVVPCITVSTLGAFEAGATRRALNVLAVTSALESDNAWSSQRGTWLQWGGSAHPYLSICLRRTSSPYRSVCKWSSCPAAA
ncbi:hypothetical protein B0H11DRAFT_1245246 [Mycena galericulata]|nr:hypothetical protein B0H11DRAFT_57156 [Mycena galericulata]KAJ7480219.1 hypothetical protein B0H11DRAFT_1245246 [Mycena galericulata]